MTEKKRPKMLEEVEDPFMTNHKVAEDPKIKENEMLIPLKFFDLNGRNSLSYKFLEGNGDLLPVRHFETKFGTILSLYKITAWTEEFAIKLYRIPDYHTTANEDPVIIHYKNKQWSIYADEKSLRNVYKKFSLHWQKKDTLKTVGDWRGLLDNKKETLKQFNNAIKKIKSQKKGLEGQIKEIKEKINQEKKRLRCPKCKTLFPERDLLSGYPNKTWICTNCNTKISRDKNSNSFNKFKNISKEIANKFHSENFQSINQFI
jgi:ribosomal protein L37AE/L43A